MNVPIDKSNKNLQIIPYPGTTEQFIAQQAKKHYDAIMSQSLRNLFYSTAAASPNIPERKVIKRDYLTPLPLEVKELILEKLTAAVTAPHELGQALYALKLLSKQHYIVANKVQARYINHHGVRVKDLGVNDAADAIAFVKSLGVDLKYLDLSGFKNISDQQIVEITDACPNITSIKVSSNALTNEGVKTLAALKNLMHVDINWCIQVSDTGIQSIAAQKKVVHLNISGCGLVTGDGIQSLVVGLKDLIHLDIGYCRRLSAEDIQALVAFTQLQCLGVAGCRKLTDECLQALVAAMKDLTGVDVSGCSRLTDAGLQSLLTIEKLERLNVHQCQNVSEAFLEGLAAHTALTHLDIGGCHAVSDECIERLAAAMTELTRLDISDCPLVENRGIRSLAKLTKLIFLNFGGCDAVTNAGMRNLSAAWKDLKSLDISGCDGIGNSGLRWLVEPLKNLTRLSVGGCYKLDNGIMPTLIALEKLRRVDLTGCNTITTKGVQRLLTARPKLKLTWEPEES